MALKLTVTQRCNLGHEHSVDDAYLRITSIKQPNGVGAYEISYSIRSEPGGELIDASSRSFASLPGSENLIASGYLGLKQLDEFASAVDA